MMMMIVAKPAHYFLLFSQPPQFFPHGGFLPGKSDVSKDDARLTHSLTLACFSFALALLAAGLNYCAAMTRQGNNVDGDF